MEFAFCGGNAGSLGPALHLRSLRTGRARRRERGRTGSAGARNRLQRRSPGDATPCASLLSARTAHMFAQSCSFALDGRESGNSRELCFRLSRSRRSILTGGVASESCSRRLMEGVLPEDARSCEQSRIIDSSSDEAVPASLGRTSHGAFHVAKTIARNCRTFGNQNSSR